MNFNSKFKIMSVTLDINDFCNMICSYCWELQNKNRLTIDNASIICDKLIENFKTHKLSNALRVHFFGGEPLLDWEVICFIVEKLKKEIPIWIGITTNATLIDEEKLKYIKENNMHVMVSIDGKRERHDNNRRMKNGSPTYDVVSKCIERLVELGVDFEARMTVLPQNGKYVCEDVTHLIENLGVKFIAPVPVYDREWTEEEMNDFGRSMGDLYDIYIKYHFDQKNKVYIKFFEDYLFKDLDVKHFGVPCGFGSNTSISIDTLGNVYPCHQVPTRKDREKFVMGNILSDEVVDNDMVKNVSHSMFKSEDCETCSANGTICSGGCLMESYEQNGDILHPTKTTCNFNRLYYREIKKIQEDRKIPFPIGPAERRDFLHSSVMKILNNVREVIKSKKEYDWEDISNMSEAMWTINEQILNNSSIHLNTPDLAREISEVSNLIRSEVLDKNG